MKKFLQSYFTNQNEAPTDRTPLLQSRVTPVVRTLQEQQDYDNLLLTERLVLLAKINPHRSLAEQELIDAITFLETYYPELSEIALKTLSPLNRIRYLDTRAHFFAIHESRKSKVLILGNQCRALTNEIHQLLIVIARKNSSAAIELYCEYKEIEREYYQQFSIKKDASESVKVENDNNNPGGNEGELPIYELRAIMYEYLLFFEAFLISEILHAHSENTRALQDHCNRLLFRLHLMPGHSLVQVKLETSVRSLTLRVKEKYSLSLLERMGVTSRQTEQFVSNLTADEMNTTLSATAAMPRTEIKPIEISDCHALDKDWAHYQEQLCANLQPVINQCSELQKQFEASGIQWSDMSRYMDQMQGPVPQHLINEYLDLHAPLRQIKAEQDHAWKKLQKLLLPIVSFDLLYAKKLFKLRPNIKLILKARSEATVTSQLHRIEAKLEKITEYFGIAYEAFLICKINMNATPESSQEHRDYQENYKRLLKYFNDLKQKYSELVQKWNELMVKLSLKIDQKFFQGICANANANTAERMQYLQKLRHRVRLSYTPQFSASMFSIWTKEINYLTEDDSIRKKSTDTLSHK